MDAGQRNHQARELPLRLLRVSRWTGRRLQRRTAKMRTVWQGRGVHEQYLRNVLRVFSRILQGCSEHRGLFSLSCQHLPRDTRCNRAGQLFAVWIEGDSWYGAAHKKGVRL